jgi:hypothetical protein
MTGRSSGGGKDVGEGQVDKVVGDESHRIYDKQISALSDRDPAVARLTSIPSFSSPGIVHTSSTNSINGGCVGDDDDAEDGNNSLSTSYDAKTSITFGGQGELPPLPIPSLEETLNRFLKNLEALQEYDDQREATKQVVVEFLQTDGPKLQELLLEYDRRGRERGEIGSYVEEFWNDAYLAPDSSVVLVRD